jgi:Fe-S-cluster-containing hydrogenase component 2
MSYEEEGVLELKDLSLPSEERLKKGPTAIIECIENIPCNPCVDACPFNAISMEKITDIPEIDYEKCTGCGTCISMCPGLAIFVVDISREKAVITIPYEFLPIPEIGDKVKALDRKGDIVSEAKVIRVKENENKTNTVTIEIDKELGMIVRNIKVIK